VIRIRHLLSNPLPGYRTVLPPLRQITEGSA
jgi:hypothetical protein